MPTATEVFSGVALTPVQRPEDARQDAGRFGANLTIARGTILAVLTSDGKLYAYTGSGTAGLQTAVGINMYDIVTNSSGQAFYSTTNSTASLTNPPFNTAPIWVKGIFDTTELTGYSGNETDVLGDLQARILHNGFISIP